MALNFFVSYHSTVIFAYFIVKKAATVGICTGKILPGNSSSPPLFLYGTEKSSFRSFLFTDEEGIFLALKHKTLQCKLAAT